MCKGKTIVNKKNSFSPILQSVLLSCFTAAGGSFLLFSFYAGTDDIISARESIILLSSAAGIAVTSFLIDGETDGASDRKHHGPAQSRSAPAFIALKRR